MIEWNPTVATILSGSKELGKIPLIITPYCKCSALEELLDAGATTDKFDLVVRFTAREIAQGSTDLEIYDALTKKGYKLYAHPSIHLKLYLFGPEKAFLTSANLTQRGLGSIASRNIETGTTVDLESEDWVQINQLLDSSRLVTSKLVEQLKMHQSTPELLEQILDDFYAVPGLSLLDLPSLPTPQQFIEAFTGAAPLTGETLQRYHCDYATYRGDLVTPDGDPFSKIQSAFLAKPFIKAFIEHLQSKGSMRFGVVTHWIHNNISERPLPYRSEIKEIVSNLYNWLTYFHDQVSWDVPGQRSQVIKWADLPTCHAHIRNPSWTHDELVLAIEVLKEIQKNGEVISKSNERIIALSRKLNAMKTHPMATRSQNFRDPDGVRARISYFQRISKGEFPNDRPRYQETWTNYHKKIK